MPTLNEIRKAHKHCSSNAKEISESKFIGCFYCINIHYTNWPFYEMVDGGETVICPMCGIDSVIGDASGIPITDELLITMHHYYFRQGYDADGNLVPIEEDL